MGGIDEHHAGLGQGDVGGNGLLVKHLGAGLTADRGKAIHWPGEGLSRLKDRRQGRPSRAIDDVQRGGRLDIRVSGERSRCPPAGTKIGHDGADWHPGAVRPSEALLGLVVEAHAEAVGIGRPIGQEGRTAGEDDRLTIHCLAANRQGGLCLLGAVGHYLQRKASQIGVAVGLAEAHINDLHSVGST